MQPPVNMDYLNKSKEYLDSQLQNSVAYSPPTRLAVRTQVIDAQQRFTGLGAVIQRRAADGSNSSGGRQLEIIVMDGTVPINYKGNWYNIPVSIRLPQGFPDSVPPMCYVTPSPGLLLKTNHPVVDGTGLCSLQGFRAGEWQSGRSNLKAAIEEMVRQFSVNPPLYAAPRPAPTAGAPAATSGAPAPARTGSLQRPSPATPGGGGSFFPGVVTPSQYQPPPKVPISQAEEMALIAAMTSMGLSDVSMDNISLINTQANILMAKDASIEDRLDSAGEQLKQEKISVEAYLKTVRHLAYDQFFVRARLLKLQPALSAVDKKVQELEAQQAYAKERARLQEEKEKRRKEDEKRQKEEEERQRREAEEAARREREEAERRQREEEARAAAAAALRQKQEEDLRKKQEADAIEARRRWEEEQDRLRRQQATQIRPPGPPVGPTVYSPYTSPYAPQPQATTFARPTNTPYYQQQQQQPSPVPPPGPAVGPSYHNPGGAAYPPSYPPVGYTHQQQQPNSYATSSLNQGHPPPYPPPPAPAGYTVISAFTGQPSGGAQRPPYQQNMPPQGPLGALGSLWQRYSH